MNRYEETFSIEVGGRWISARREVFGTRKLRQVVFCQGMSEDDSQTYRSGQEGEMRAVARLIAFQIATGQSLAAIRKEGS